MHRKWLASILLSLFSLLEEVPILNSLFLFLMLTIGFPMYLIINAGGHKKYSYQLFGGDSHFNPESPTLFAKRQKRDVYIGLAGILVMIAALYVFALKYGFVALFKYYGLPLLFNNAFFIMYTFLHHTHGAVPHYKAQVTSSPLFFQILF